MRPSIPIYNDLLDDYDWLQLLKMPEMRLLTADMSIYRKLSKYIFPLLETMDKEDVLFIENHE